MKICVLRGRNLERASVIYRMTEMNISRFELPDPMGWLSRLNESTRLQVLQSCDVMPLKAGETIYHAEDPAGGIFTTLSGRLDAHWPHLAAGRTLVHAVGPGWWIGDLSVVTGMPRRVELTAGLDSEILRLSRAQLLRIAETVPEIHFALLTMMAATVRLCADIIESRSLDDPRKRVASALSRLNTSGQSWNGHIPITQIELASMCMISRGGVINALQYLEEEELAKNSYGRIHILDLCRLNEFIHYFDND